MASRRRRTIKMPQSISMMTGVVYAFAIIISIALGAVFYKGYRAVQQEQEAALRNPAQSRAKLQPIPLDKSTLPPGATSIHSTAPARTGRSQSASTPSHMRRTQGTLPSPIRRTPWSPAGHRFHRPMTLTVIPVADTTIIVDPPSERKRNSGKASRIYLQGNTSFALAKFDMDVLRGLTITSAVWHAKVDSGKPRVIGFSTVMTDWEEGDGRGRGSLGHGANYHFTGIEKSTWYADNGPAPYVVRGNGQSLFSAREVAATRATSREWIEIPIHPLLIQAMIAGASHGLAIFDESGQASITPMAIYSRETSDSYYLSVKGELIDTIPPGEIGNLTCRSADALILRDSVGVVLEWTAAGDDRDKGQAFRYVIRYADSGQRFEQATPVPLYALPFPPQPAGEKDHAIITGLKPNTSYTFFVRAVDEVGKYGPIAKTTRTTPHVLDVPKPEQHMPTYDDNAVAMQDDMLQIRVISALAAVDPINGKTFSKAGGRGGKTSDGGATLWDARNKTMHLEALRNESVQALLVAQAPQAQFPGLALHVGPLLSQDGGKIEASRIHLSQVIFHRKPGGAWRGDALVPIQQSLEVPWSPLPVSGQTTQPILFEVDVPEDTPPGMYTGPLALNIGKRKLELTVQLEVLDGTLDHPGDFTIELLAPMSLAALYGRDTKNTEAALPIERAYYRMAREHDCTFTLQPYSPRGECPRPFSPRLAQQVVGAQVSSWTDWDARFGPALSGTIFDDKQAVPVSHLILPLFENWPSPLDQSYTCQQWNYRDVATRTMVFAGPSDKISTCLSRAYWNSLGAVGRDFAEHFSEKNWRDTVAHVWMNNVPTNHYVGMSPPWRLGLPVFRADFMALQCYARNLAADAATSWAPGGMMFRVNVSDATCLQKYGRGLFNLLSVSDTRDPSWRQLRQRGRLYGDVLWLASDQLPFDTPTVIPAIGLEAFTQGATGWNIRDAAGSNDDWKRANPSSILYCGAWLDKDTPYSSLRLKALQRTAAIISMLRSIMQSQGWTAQQSRAFISQYVNISTAQNKANAEDWEDFQRALRALVSANSQEP